MIKTTLEPATIEQEELRGIARTVAELEWLLLILVLLYRVFAEREPDTRAALSAANFFFASMILAFRYTNDALIGRANRAMYTVKQAGRDGVANFGA